ncbi:phosphatase PAP2 family protein [Fodinicola acaciae]|uniref:phosphatase PAP2 family protein n=1 Tax=Fodinicola acaciae TaxID=2681555 RepID=UPI0013D7A044|nr:phosphatase PAP2 family protein [Fodinicola acaciae]
MSTSLVRSSRPRLSQLVAAGVIALLVLTFGFLALLDAVNERDGIAGWDQPVLAFAVHHRAAPLTGFFATVTALGAGPGLVVVALAVAALGMWRLRSIWPGVLVLVTLVGAELVSTTAKVLVHRARPPHGFWLSNAGGYSYPSGHALLSASTYSVLAFVGCCLVRALWARLTVALAAGAMVVAVSVSRVYLGVHWLTDVLAGTMVGLGWLTLVLVGAGVASHPPFRRSVRSLTARLQRSRPPRA